MVRQINPFIYGKPVPPSHFVGREAVIDHCYNRLAGPVRTSIAISGEHGIGKTSLLYFLKHLAEKEEWGRSYGHILFALLGSRQRPLAWLFFALLIPLGLLWAGWWVWATLVFAIGRGRMQHPPLFNDQETPRGGRLWLGIIAGVMFALSFVPIPFLI